MVGPGEDDARQHVSRYLNSVDDARVTDAYISLGLPDIEALAVRMEAVEMSERERGLKPGSRSHREQRDSFKGNSLSDNTYKANQRRVSFPQNPVRPPPAKYTPQVNTGAGRVMEDEDEHAQHMSDYDNRDYYEGDYYDNFPPEDSPRGYDDQDYVLAGQQSQGFSRPSPQLERNENNYTQLPLCTRCQRGRHPVADCGFGKRCTACERFGHIESRCLHKCKTCMVVHPPGQCEYNMFVDAMKKWMHENPQSENIPKHLREMLPLNDKAA